MFAAHFSEDSVMRTVANGEVTRGCDELRADVEVVLRAFPELRIERKNAYECGEAVCSSVNVSGTKDP